MVRAWNRSVSGAAVPKTPINKHGELQFGEHNVGSHTSRRQINPKIFAESHASPVQRTPQCDLNRRVPVSVRPHGSAGLTATIRWCFMLARLGHATDRKARRRAARSPGYGAIRRTIPPIGSRREPVNPRVLR